MPRLQERGHRYYSANLARWINRDPIGEFADANVYSFVRNEPVSANDWYGLFTVKKDGPHYYWWLHFKVLVGFDRTTIGLTKKLSGEVGQKAAHSEPCSHGKERNVHSPKDTTYGIYIYEKWKDHRDPVGDDVLSHENKHFDYYQEADVRTDAAYNHIFTGCVCPECALAQRELARAYERLFYAEKQVKHGELDFKSYGKEWEEAFLRQEAAAAKQAITDAEAHLKRACK